MLSLLIARYDKSLGINDAFMQVIGGCGGLTRILGVLYSLGGNRPHAIVRRAEGASRSGSVEFVAQAAVKLPVDFQPAFNLFLSRACVRDCQSARCRGRRGWL